MYQNKQKSVFKNYLYAKKFPSNNRVLLYGECREEFLISL